MKWKQMFFTIVLNIFLMLLVSIMLEYSNLTERFVDIEDTIQEALDMSLEAAVHSEEFFSAKYQTKLMSYAGVGDYNNDQTAEATTLVWLKSDRTFAQVNTYQFAKWYWDNYEDLPLNSGEVTTIRNVGASGHYGIAGEMFKWLYGGVGSDYLNTSLAYANKNSARIIEYTMEGSRAPGTNRGQYNSDFMNFYNGVGQQQQTVGYLKHRMTGSTTSYELSLQTYPVLDNMGLSWMTGSGFTSATSEFTSDNLCSSLHIGKSRSGSLNTYYFLTPISLGVTYIPVEVLKPVMVANLDTIVRLNKLGASSQKDVTEMGATEILASASYCNETDVYDYNLYTDAYTNPDSHEYDYSATGDMYHAIHRKSSYSETIVSDGLVEFDLDTLQVKVDYFYYDFSSGSPEAATLISRLNGILSYNTGGATSIDDLRDLTLSAFQDQDSSKNVSSFLGESFSGSYYGTGVGEGRVIARVTAKIKVHVPYQSSILQWASYMFTGTHHFDIKRYNPTSGLAITDVDDGDGLWYQYTTYYCTSRS